jgi:SsrA-binding protein
VEKTIIKNPKAFRDYQISERFECGIELKGCEVKSLRESKASLADSFARIENGEVFLYNMHISPYEKTSQFFPEPKRKRKLLFHKNQIRRLIGKVEQKRFTLIPLRCYFNERGFAKIELGLARGKRLYERREDIKKREAELEIRRMMKRG